MVKLFEEFILDDLVQDGLNEKQGLSTITKLAGDKLTSLTLKDLNNKAVYVKRTSSGKPWQKGYTLIFDKERNKELIAGFGADGIFINVTLDVGPTLFKKDTYVEGSTERAPVKTTNGLKLVLVKVRLTMAMDVYDNEFEKGAKSAEVDLRSVVYHELTHAYEFNQRRSNGAFVQTSKELAYLQGSRNLENIITKNSEEDIPYFFTRFFQLMYISTSYETNAFAAMVVADLERHTFKKREDFDSLKDYLVSQHDTLLLRQKELIKTNSWINYVKLKDFSMADFIKQLEDYGTTFDVFFKSLTQLGSSTAKNVMEKEIKDDTDIHPRDKAKMLVSMQDTINLLLAQKSKDPVIQMRLVAKKISDARDRLGKRLMRMVTYE